MAVVGLQLSTSKVTPETQGFTPDHASLKSTVAANIATLVADGAAPTQAHVNTLNTSWSNFTMALPAPTADVSIFVNTATVTRNKLRDALDAAYRYFAYSDGITS